MQQVANISKNLPSVLIRSIYWIYRWRCLQSMPGWNIRVPLLRPLGLCHLLTTYYWHPSHAATPSKHLQDIKSKLHSRRERTSSRGLCLLLLTLLALVLL